MKYFKIKAFKFDELDVNDNSLYIIQELEKKFTIWEDHFGEFEYGEDPIFSNLNETLDGYDNLDEVRYALEGFIDPNDKFIILN